MQLERKNDLAPDGLLNTEQLGIVIEDFLASSPSNQVPELGIERIYTCPLVGVASANDPLFSGTV